MTPEEHEYAFKHELGSAICQWAWVEQGMQHVLMSVVKDRLEVVYAFTKLESFKTSLDFLSNMVTATQTDSALLDRWNRLADRIVTASRTRNKLAHWRVVLRHDSPNEGLYFLQPHKWPTKKFDEIVSEPRLSIKDVAHAAAVYEDLANCLLNFRSALEGKPEQRPECAQPQGVQRPAMSHIANRIRAATGRQPQPSRGSLPPPEQEKS